MTDAGFRLRPPLATAGADTVRLTVLVAPPLRVAVIVATTLALTGVVVIVNVAESAPAGIVTDAGTVAAALLELSVTTVSVDDFVGMMTVPVDEAPPVTVSGVA
jgi:hypothetical protein